MDYSNFPDELQFISNAPSQKFGQKHISAVLIAGETESKILNLLP